MAGNRVISAVLTLKDRNFASGVKKATTSTKDMERQVKHTRNQVKDFGRTATDNFKRVGAAVGAYFAVDALKNFTVSITESAAAANALSAQFEQVFGADAGEATGVVDNLGEAFGMLPNRIKPAYTAATSMFKGLGLETGEAMDVAERSVTAVADAAAFYDKSFEDANGSLNSFIKGNYEGGESIGLFANETQLSAWAADNLGLKWKDLGEADKQIARMSYAEEMMKSAGATGQAMRESESYENQLGNLKQSWTDMKSKLGQAVLEPAIEGMKRLSTAVQNIDAEAVAQKMKDFGGAAVNAYNNAKPGLDWLKDMAFPAIKTAVEEFYNASKTAFGWIKDNLPIVTAAVAGLATGLAAYKILTGINTAFGIFKTLMVAVKTQTLLQTAAQWGLNTAMLASPLTWVAVGIGVVVAAGILLWKNWDTVKEKASTLWSVVKEKFGEMKTKVVEWFGGMKDSAVEKFGNIVQTAKDLPGKIGQGIADYASDAVTGMKNLATSLMTAFKKALGIASPSKKMFEMGGWIVKGLVNGLNAGNLKSLGKTIFKDFAGGALNTLESIKGFFTDGFTGNAGDTINLGGKGLVNQLAKKHGLRITSGHRPGARTPYGNLSDHATGNAYDVGGSMQGMWQAALEAKNNPQVKYVIARNMISYGGGPWKPYPYGGHMDHTHISLKGGREQGGQISSSGRYLVGEAGPEVVDLPAGSRVHNNQNSKGMNESKPEIHIHINGVGMSVQEIMDKLMPILKLRLANL